jgi:hypothetical protein
MFNIFIHEVSANHFNGSIVLEVFNITKIKLEVVRFMSFGVFFFKNFEEVFFN